MEKNDDICTRLLPTALCTHVSETALDLARTIFFFRADYISLENLKAILH